MSEVEIADELINLSRISSVGILNFIDDSFNIPNQRFKTILQIMIEGQFNFQWHSFFRCCAIDAVSYTHLDVYKRQGPYHYPKHDRTPYGAFPVDHTPFIILVNLWTINIIDIETDKIVYSSYFNRYNDPISFTGHSLYISSTLF